MSDTLRVLTFNVLALAQASGAARHAIIERGLPLLRPDIVALQEVTRSADLDQAVELLGPGFTIVDHPGSGADGVGACLASRWPIVSVHVLDLHVVPGAVGLPWAATVVAEIAAPAPLGRLVAVHHKPHWQLDREFVREQQAVAAARFIDDLMVDRPMVPVVLLGDFDAGPETASIRFWTGRQSLSGTSVRYESAWETRHPGEPGHTFTPRNPLVRGGEMPLETGRRIDHIMVRSGSHGPALEVVDCRIVFDEPVNGVWPSDHFGVFAELRLPPTAHVLNASRP